MPDVVKIAAKPSITDLVLRTSSALSSVPITAAVAALLWIVVAATCEYLWAKGQPQLRMAVIGVLVFGILAFILEVINFIWDPRRIVKLDIPQRAFWVLGGFVAWFWAFAVQQGDFRRTLNIAGLEAAAFMTGAVLGFIFTSFGEESGTFGKIRDLLIGGLAGLTITQVVAQKIHLNQFLDFYCVDVTRDRPLVLSTAIVWFAAGFFVMFFQRELILNTLLARKRWQRDVISGAKAVANAVRELRVALPPNILAGNRDIDSALEDADNKDQRRKELEKILFSTDVEAYLKDATTASEGGFTLSWNLVANVANLYYYRNYLDNGDRETAAQWLLRALHINPTHADLTMKYADVLADTGEYHAAVAELERLRQAPDCPLVASQWLGYYLLYIPNNFDSAIRYSQSYLGNHPEDPNTLLNLACGWAQKLDQAATEEREECKKQVLHSLASVLRIRPSYRQRVNDLRKQDFKSLDSDTDFCMLVQPNQTELTDDHKKTA